MTYEDFLEAQQLMLQYAQNAINIFDEIYNCFPKKFKGRVSIKEIPNVKRLSFGGNSDKPYIVDPDEATFNDDGICFKEEIFFRGELEDYKEIRIPSNWIIPDQSEQTRLIKKFLDKEFESIREYVEVEEAKAQQKKKEAEEIKEQRERQEYERLRNKFEK